MVAALLAALVVMLIAVATVWPIVRDVFRKRATQLPGLYPGTKYAGSVSVDPRFIAECLKKAEEVLLKHSPWSASQLHLVISQLTVVVVDSDAWVDQHGPDQAKRLFDPTLVVNQKLEGLCHELAHRCQWMLDTLLDDNHLTWNMSGIWTAAYEYEAWLNGTRFISSSR